MQNPTVALRAVLIAAIAFSPLATSVSGITAAQTPATTATPVNLRRADALTAIQVKVSAGTFRDKEGVLVEDQAPASAGDAARLVLVKGPMLQDGAIDLDVEGNTAPNADVLFRGFVGIAFRVSPDASRFECFYLRPKNGHAEDQLQRNHSTQYISIPGYPWQKLRTETPGKYESWVDIAPGEWVHLHVVFEGVKAKLYVNHAREPALVVNDLKQPPAAGGVALWIGPGTIAHFSDLRVSAKP